jgi:hypothetical protein
MFGSIVKLLGGTNWLIDQVIKYLIVPVLKKSGKGWKAALGLLLLVLGYLVEHMIGSPAVPIMQQIIDVVQPHAYLITDGAIIVLVTGIMDKLYKMFPTSEK